MFNNLSKNQKRALLLGLISTILVILYYAPSILKKLNYKPQPAFSNLNTITEISLKLDDQPQKAVLKDNKWVIEIDKNYYPAESKRITDLIEYLKKLEIKDVVSKNVDKNKDFFELNKEIQIKNNDNKTFTLYLGKIAQSGDLYANIKGQKTVFIAENLNGLLLPTDFRDLNLHLINESDEVENIEVKGNNRLTITKNNNDWTVNGQKADLTKINNYIFDLTNMRADDIALKQTRTNPVLTLTIKTKNKEYQYNFYKDQDSFVVNIGDYDYKIAENQLNIIDKPAQDLISQN
ncbi:MAG: hypothetical protein KatS3mg090_0079 [Patescibacteria group bacterium]|nr:MAG: hypothetical protein KatS3mg090_0079 [Patescibacteria group bacterium]